MDEGLHPRSCLHPANWVDHGSEIHQQWRGDVIRKIGHELPAAPINILVDLPSIVIT